MRQRCTSACIAAAAASALLLAAAAPGPSPKAPERSAPVWVFLGDKGPIDVGAALADLQRTYNPRAIERRRLRRTAAGLFDERDLPVYAPYVSAIAQRGAVTRTTSRWLNAVSVSATADQVRDIAALPFVAQVQPVNRIKRQPASLPTRPVEPGEGGPAGGGAFYGLSEDQLTQINVPALHQAGFTGEGVIIGVLDTGFKTTHAAFNNPVKPLLIVAEYDFLNDDPEAGPEPGDIANQHHHGTQVLGTMAAYNPGTLVGGGYDAGYILAKCEDLAGEYLAEEDLFVAGLEFIEANGGDVATSSLVIYDYYQPEQFDGLTSVMTVGFNTATANGLHCLQGIGNAGHDADPATTTMIPPADAFQVITVGSVDVNGTTASFTSDGPTADGRVKPEVMARGVLSRTVHPDNDAAYQEVNGASFATPTSAGAVACIVQAHPEWTVEQMRWALIHTADDYVANQTFDPLYIRGYGILNAFGAAGSAPPAPGDLDEDGDVDTVDLLGLLGAWGPCPQPCPPHCSGDIDTDCDVGVIDLLILLGNWG